MNEVILLKRQHFDYDTVYVESPEDTDENVYRVFNKDHDVIYVVDEEGIDVNSSDNTKVIAPLIDANIMAFKQLFGRLPKSMYNPYDTISDMFLKSKTRKLVIVKASNLSYEDARQSDNFEVLTREMWLNTPLNTPHPDVYYIPYSEIGVEIRK